MFVTYDCGCVGLVITQPSAYDGDVTTHINITRCDSSGYDNEIGFSHRTGNAEKSFVPVGDHAAQKLIKRIDSLIGDGYSARKIKRELGFISE